MPGCADASSKPALRGSHYRPGTSLRLGNITKETTAGEHGKTSLLTSPLQNGNKILGVK